MSIQELPVSTCKRCKQPYTVSFPNTSPGVCLSCLEMEWRIERDPDSFPIPSEVRTAVKFINNTLYIKDEKLRDYFRIIYEYFNRIGDRRIKERRKP